MFKNKSLTFLLEKLDAVQRAAKKIGGFEVESLQSRREAAAICFTLKLMGGNGRGVLKDMAQGLKLMTSLPTENGAGIPSLGYS